MEVSVNQVFATHQNVASAASSRWEPPIPERPTKEG